MGKAQNRQLHEGRGTNNYMYKKEGGVEKMQTLAELVDGKYDEEVTIAVLVSKLK